MKFVIARTQPFALKKGTRAVFTGLAAVGLAVNLFGCGGGNSGSKSAADSKLLYTESNDPTRNVILAFRRASDGSLTPLASSPIDLRGQGFANPQEQPGPPDADQQIVTNASHTLLFAVNSGSNTIAVMKINSDGQPDPHFRFALCFRRHKPVHPVPAGQQTLLRQQKRRVGRGEWRNAELHGLQCGHGRHIDSTDERDSRGKRRFLSLASAGFAGRQDDVYQ